MESDGLTERFMRVQMLLNRRQIACHRAYGPFGSPARGQGRVLSILRMQPTISQKQLSYLLDMRQQSLSELVAKLEKSGLIERAQSEDDRRAVIIALTEKGREAASGADASIEDDGPFGSLTDDEKAQLARLMDKVIEALEAGSADMDREDFRRGCGPMRRPPFGPGPFGPRAGFGPGGFEEGGPFGPEGPADFEPRGEGHGGGFREHRGEGHGGGFRAHHCDGRGGYREGCRDGRGVWRGDRI